MKKMVKEYKLSWYSPSVYKVEVTHRKKNKTEIREHIVSYKKDWNCDCKGYHYRKSCKHLKLILSQVKDGGGIIDYQEKETWQSQHFTKR